MIRESVIEQYLFTKVQEHGGRAIKFTSSNLRALPDRICLFPGPLTVFVEVKAPGRTPSAEQRLMLDWLRQRGFLAVWLDGRPAVDALMEWLIENRGVVRNVPHRAELGAHDREGRNDSNT